MAKEQRLSQLLANRDTVKATTNPQFTELQKSAKVPSLFSGMSKTYKKKDEDGEDQPPQNVRVQKRVVDIMDDLRRLCAQQFDAVASVDLGNTIAKANVVVEGVELLTDVPVTFLLTLEKDIKQIRSLVVDLPTLDPAHDWHVDSAVGLFKTDEIFTNRTAKLNKPIVLYPATDKHPAQTAMNTVDETVGQWASINMSGAFAVDQKKKLLARCDQLISAVQSAREEANSVKTSPASFGNKIFDFLLK